MNRMLNIVAILAVGSLCAATGCKKDKTNGEESQLASEQSAIKPRVIVEKTETFVKAPAGEESSKELKAAAEELFSELSEIQAALDAKDSKAAIKHLDLARKAIEEIKKERPMLRVVSQVWDIDGSLAVAVEETPVAVVPLVTSVKEIPEFIADPGVLETFGSDAKHPVELVDSTLLYSAIDLPVTATDLDLVTMKGFLVDNEIGHAKAVLREIQEILVPSVFMVEAPVIQARNSVVAARVAFAAGKVEAVKKHVKDARTALAAIGEDSIPAVKEAAKKLDKALGPLEEGTDLASKAQKLSFDAIIPTLGALVGYEGRRLSIAGTLAEQRKELNLALLHLSLGDILTSIKIPDKESQFVAARRALVRAATVADSVTKPKIDHLGEQIAKMEVLPRGAQRYRMRADITAELRDLLYRLSSQD